MEEENTSENPRVISQLTSISKGNKLDSNANIQKYDFTIKAQGEDYGKVFNKSLIETAHLRDLDIYFLPERLSSPGGKMKLHFTSVYESKFLPIKVSSSVPFSHAKLPEILSLLAVKPNSTKAIVIEEAIKSCEKKANVGEKTKHCPTSLEDMVDYVVSSLGNNVKVFTTTIDEESSKDYVVEKVQKVSDDVSLVCHKKKYPYAVFYCHEIEKTDAYVVSLVDDNGKKSIGGAVCHKDTKNWASTHLAFQLLNAKPGDVSVCHFLDANDMIWTSD